jgi:photosystem II stability/assembly factor-like uncharacterized protein
MKTLVALFLLAFAWSGALAQTSAPAWRFVGPEGGNVAHIAAWNDTLYAAADNGRLFRSSDGASWQEITTLETFRTASGLFFQNGVVHQAFLSGAFRYDDFGGGLYFVASTNAAVTWSRFLTGVGSPPFGIPAIVGIVALRQQYITASFLGIIRYTYDTSFIPRVISRDTVVTTRTLSSIAGRGRMILAGTRDSVLYRSRDSGATWQQITLGFAPRALVVVNDSLAFAASANAVFRSLDGGTLWQQTAVSPSGMTIQGLAFAYNALYAATPLGVMRSRTLGQDWQSVNTGLSTRTISGIVANDSAVFANIPTLSGYHRFENDRFTPVTLPNGRSPTFMGVTQTLFWATSSDSVLWRSGNGRDWSRIGVLPSSGATLYAITGQNQDREVYISIAKGVFRTSNLGQSWETLAAFGPFDLNADNTSIISLGDTIWLAGYGIYRSKDRGQTFQRLTLGRYSLDGKRIYTFQLVTHQGVVYASGVYFGVYDDIGDWMLPISRINFDSTGVGNFDSYAASRYLASRRGELLRGERLTRLVEYLPTNVTWQRFQPIPLTTATMSALGANGKNVFAGTNSGLFVLNAVATSVLANEERANPSEALQLHAFPNPAFGDVVLKTSLPRRTTLRLSIFDALGQEVARLADGSEYEAGEQEFVWSPAGVAAKSVSQGVYVARLQAGTTVTTTKILLVK